MGHSTSSGRGSGSIVNGYMQRISRLETMDDLNSLAEEAANDDRITNDDYIRIYGAALDRVNTASQEEANERRRRR